MKSGQIKQFSLFVLIFFIVILSEIIKLPWTILNVITKK